MRVVIIGAGPTGLGAATRLAELGHEDFLVLEKEGHVGGHAASFRTPEGFTFDMGGHVTFSRDRRFLDVVGRALAGRFLTHERRAFVYTHGRFVPYPFQNNIASLPRDVAWECVEGLLDRRAGNGVPPTFAAYMERTFGRGITRHFMMPYNRKVWAYDPAAMSVSWMGDRVSQVSLEDVLRPFVFGPESRWGPNATFRYPEEGTGAIYRKLASELPPGRLRLGVEVSRIDAGRRAIALGSGEVLRYDALISSMPLDVAVRSLVRPSRAARREADRLAHNQGFFVGVGVRGHSPVENHWTYFPEKRFPFYRVTVLSHYSPRLTPSAAYYSLLAEVSLSAARRVRPGDLSRRVVGALQATPLLKGRTDRDIACLWWRVAPYSYPIPTLGHEAARAYLLAYLERQGIYSRGRFGAWAYERGNMDHSFLAGVDAATLLC